jgi:hypothetical protein
MKIMCSAVFGDNVHYSKELFVSGHEDETQLSQATATVFVMVQ